MDVTIGAACTADLDVTIGAACTAELDVTISAACTADLDVTIGAACTADKQYFQCFFSNTFKRSVLVLKFSCEVKQIII